MQQIRLTIPEAAASIQRQYGGRLVPDWKLRRVVDILENQGAISVQRAATYRTIADSDLCIIADELRRIGRLVPSAEAVPCR